jgi:DNA-binding NtrC family response regulator
MQWMRVDVVEVAAITVVDVTNFLTASNASIEAFKTANLLKGLSVNAIICGESSTGKLTLARYILPNAPIVHGNNFDELLNALETNSALILHRLDDVANLKRLIEKIGQTKTRVIATGGFRYTPQQLEELFTISFVLPPLREREEDIAVLSTLFLDEAKKIFGKNDFILPTDFSPDVSENALSLRRQLYLNYLLSNASEENVLEITENYLLNRLGGNNDYRQFLHLFEVPLIRAGIKRFKSQLQLSDRLGLNRNTLRKKIAEHSHYNLELKE